MWQTIRVHVRHWVGGLTPRRQSPAEVLIVRHGLSDAYYEFLGIFARVNQVAIIIDRRTNERRHPDGLRSLHERRAGDRRGPAPATWDWGDVVVFRSRRS